MTKGTTQGVRPQGNTTQDVVRRPTIRDTTFHLPLALSKYSS